MRDEKLFEDAVVEEVRKKIQSEGLKGIDTKELLVLIAGYFNDEVSNIQKTVHDEVSNIQETIRKIGYGALWALWAIVASLIAGFIIALLTLK